MPRLRVKEVHLLVLKRQPGPQASRLTHVSGSLLGLSRDGGDWQVPSSHSPCAMLRAPASPRMELLHTYDVPIFVAAA